LTGGLSATEIALQVFDTDGDGQADATLVKFSSNNGDRILAVVLGTVNAAGTTTLTNADFITLPNNSF
jgi:serralysin